MAKIVMSTLEQCPRCFGRGYIPNYRQPSRRNPHGLGFRAQNCPRCTGSGQIVKVSRVKA